MKVLRGIKTVHSADGALVAGVVDKGDTLRLWAKRPADLTPAVAAELADVLRAWVNTRPADWSTS